MYNITAQFPIGKLRAAFVGNVAIFTLIGWIAIMLLVLFLQFHFLGPLYEFPKLIKILIFVVTPVPGFLFGLWFANKEINKGRWQLTDSELLRGIHGQQKFPLASIEKIIVGLPTWKTARNVSLAIAIKENSLLICFKDGSWLPLRLIAVPNGPALMDTLRERCEDRVIESYDYSHADIRRLRRRDMNELIPPPKN